LNPLSQQSDTEQGKQKACGSITATLTMVFKLATSAEKKWRKLKGCEMIGKVINGVIFKEGEEVLEKEKVV